MGGLIAVRGADVAGGTGLTAPTSISRVAAGDRATSAAGTATHAHINAEKGELREGEEKRHGDERDRGGEISMAR